MVTFAVNTYLYCAIIVYKDHNKVSRMSCCGALCLGKGYLTGTISKVKLVMAPLSLILVKYFDIMTHLFLITSIFLNLHVS